MCGYSFKDIIFKLDNFPVENSNISYQGEVSYNFSGVFNTLRALCYLDKKIKIKIVTILGKDNDGINGIKELNILKYLSKIIKFIVVHNQKKSIVFVNGKLIQVSNIKNFSNKNINITGAGDTYAASLLCDLLKNKMIDNKSILKAHKLASDYCFAKLY